MSGSKQHAQDRIFCVRAVVNSDYFLYKEEGGWDIVNAGDLSMRTPDHNDSLEQQLSDCGKWCDQASGCTIFLYLDGNCYLKQDVGSTPEFVGPGSRGWGWLYIEQDK